MRASTCSSCTSFPVFPTSGRSSNDTQKSSMQPRRAVEDTIATLRAQFGDRLSTVPALLERHGQDESYHPPHPPDAVVFAQSTEEVVQIVRVCAEHRTPIIPYGVGTSLEGNIAAVRGGMCIDLSTMNRVLAIDREDLDCRVQP